MPKHVAVKSILNKTKKRDAWFLDDYTINPYRACSFNCLYCYIRGSKYGAEMEESLAIKENAVELLRKQLSLRARKNQYGIIVLASATDPYLQIEKELGLTRQLLEVILEFRFPVHIITKSDLVLRDLDLLERIHRHSILPPELQDKLSGGTLVTFSFSSVDDAVGKIFEPGATPPSARLKALQQVSAAGLPTGVSMMPLLPYISDTTESLEAMFTSFKQAGAAYVMPATITLFGNERADSKPLLLNAVRKHYPELIEKYERFFQSSHEMPARYRAAFYQKMKEMAEKYEVKDRIVRF